MWRRDLLLTTGAASGHVLPLQTAPPRGLPSEADLRAGCGFRGARGAALVVLSFSLSQDAIQLVLCPLFFFKPTPNTDFSQSSMK